MAWGHGKSAGLRTPFIMRRRRISRNEYEVAALAIMIDRLYGGDAGGLRLTKRGEAIKQFIRSRPNWAELNGALAAVLGEMVRHVGRNAAVRERNSAFAELAAASLARIGAERAGPKDSSGESRSPPT